MRNFHIDALSDACDKKSDKTGTAEEEWDMAFPQVKGGYSFTDYLEWNAEKHSDKGTHIRYELIEGQPVMLATPSIAHQIAVGNIFAQLHQYLIGRQCKVLMAPLAVALFADSQTHDDEIKTTLEPDIMVVCDPEKLRSANRVTGAPDMMVEVLSPSTQRHDRLIKFNQYWRAGVREYWIVNPNEKWVQVFLLKDGIYQQATIGFENDLLKVQILEDCTIDLGAVFTE